MGLSRTLVTVVVAATTLTTTAVGTSGCGGKSSPPATSSTQTAKTTASSPAPPAPASPSAQATDYTGLLMNASDIDAPEPFTASAPTQNPNGQPGVATTFSVQDGSRVIHDTIQVFADPAAATAALDAAKAGFAKTLKDPKVDQTGVGTGGATAYGNTVDGTKGEAILVFTSGRAFVTLEFAGPPNLGPPPEFVEQVGQKQDAAVKKGLGG